VEDPDTADLLLGDRYFGDVGFPFTISPPRRPSPSYKRRIVGMTYEDVGFSVERRAGVFVIAILADGSRTSKGVGLGSTGQEVKAAYPGLECGSSNARAEEAPRPFCSGRVATGIHVWFGEDPVKSVLIATGPFL